jgi:hypothetical protein
MKLYETLELQFKKEPNFVTDNGELKKWVALNKAQNFDEELITLLLQNDTLKEKFFRTLRLPKQNQHLSEIMGNNQPYANLSSLNDTDFNCTDKEKQVTGHFYQLTR